MTIMARIDYAAQTVTIGAYPFPFVGMWLRPADGWVTRDLFEIEYVAGGVTVTNLFDPAHVSEIN